MERNLVPRLAIARELNVKSQTVAKWERQGWFPQPTNVDLVSPDPVRPFAATR